MPYNGSGTFTPYTPGNPVVSGTVISSTAFNSTQSDIAAGLTNAVTRDGQSPPTANLPMGGKKLTGLVAGTVAGDSLRWEQLFSQGTEQDLASEATTDIGAQNTTVLRITGTTGITSFGTNYNGPRFVRFADALVLTHNATTLILPTGANITTAAGDHAILVPAGNPVSGWQVVAYQTASGRAFADLLNTTRMDVASAATVDLTANAPNTRNINITGTTTITAFTVAVGQLYFVRFNAALTLTNNAAIVTQTGVNISTVAGATCILRATAANVVEVLSYVAPNADLQHEIQPILATVNGTGGAPANGMRITVNPTTLDFRSATLNDGSVTTLNLAVAQALDIPSTATMGTYAGVLARFAVLLINNAGMLEPAVVNIGGGFKINESGVISTTAMTTASDNASVAYSAVARTNVSYRVVGYIENTQATPGTYVTAPSKVQGAGGNSLTNVNNGRTWKTVARSPGTTYYNEDETDREVKIVSNAGAGIQFSFLVDGVGRDTCAFNGTSGIISVGGTVPPGSYYSLTATAGTVNVWSELSAA